MINEVLGLLQRITDACMALTGQTMMNMNQEKCAENIRVVSEDLFNVVISIPDLTWDKARELFSFETRQHLASMIGYAEVLLDEEDGPLTNDQRALVMQIRSDARRLLTDLGDLEQ